MKNRPLRAMFVLGTTLGVGVVSMAGCGESGNQRGCPVLGDCAGDPTGVWQLTSSSATCSALVDVRPKQSTAPAETLVPAPATASGTWCSDFVFDDAGALVPTVPVMPFTVATQPLANPDVVTSGTVTFAADQTYVYSFTASSHTTTHFARSCLGVNGANLTCAQFATNVQMVIGVSTNPVYSNFTCADASDHDGCDCSFDYTEPAPNVGDAGRWVVQGHEIVLYSKFSDVSVPNHVHEATFCVTNNGQTLQLSGYRGADLAQKAGLRTMTLTNITALSSEPTPEAGP
jgi:hypothetical protein